MVNVTPLTHCKTATCRAPITVDDVYKDQVVKESPQHIVVTFRCPKCERADRMVGTNESWDAFKRDAAVEEAAAVDTDKVMKAAEIEMNAIDSVDDLTTLWKSYKTPPLIEEVMNACPCDDCKRRRTV